MHRENCFTEGGDQFFVLFRRYLMGRKASPENLIRFKVI
jgi:hypothetical protein